MSEDKMKFKQILSYEKAVMHPLNRFMSYVVTPIYLVVSALIIIAFAVLMAIDDKKYFVIGMSLLALFAIASILLLSAVPYIRKRVIKDEMNGYDFDCSGLENALEYDYSTDDIVIVFDKYGMCVDGALFYYNHLHISIITENYFHRILIAVRFALDDEHFIQIRLDAKVLKMIYDFQIPIQNEEVLNYILNNKESAFTQIYNKGYISVPAK